MNRVRVLLWIGLCAQALIGEASARITVELGSVVVDLDDFTGTLATSIDVDFGNTSTSAAPLAGYTLFLDIGPAGPQLPRGVTIAETAVTFHTGLGSAPLTEAGPGVVNLNPPAGDLGLAQLQFTDSLIRPGEQFSILTVNLLIDRELAIPDAYDIFLSSAGENSIDAFAGRQPFDVVNGTLALMSSAGLQGDFDQDDDVDGQDYLGWQRGNSPAGGSSNDLAAWSSNYGTDRQPPSQTITILPEPEGLSMLVIGTVASVTSWPHRWCRQLNANFCPDLNVESDKR